MRWQKLFEKKRDMRDNNQVFETSLQMFAFETTRNNMYKSGSFTSVQFVVYKSIGDPRSKIYHIVLFFFFSFIFVAICEYFVNLYLCFYVDVCDSYVIRIAEPINLTKYLNFKFWPNWEIPLHSVCIHWPKCYVIYCMENECILIFRFIHKNDISNGIENSMIDTEWVMEKYKKKIYHRGIYIVFCVCFCNAVIM